MDAASPSIFSRIRGPLIALVCLAASCAVWFIVPAIFGLIASAGTSLSEPDVVADYITGVCWALALLVVLLVLPVPKPDKKPLVILWIAKCFVTLVAMLYYEQTYTSLDAYAYYSNSDPNSFIPAAFVMGKGTANVTRLAAMQSMFLPHSFHALKVTWAFMGLIGIYVTYLAWTIYLGRRDIRLFYVIGLFPGILFWSSILGKDPIALLGISLYIYGVIGYLKRGGARYIVIGALGTFISMTMRTWLGLILLMPLGIVVLLALPRMRDKILMLSILFLVVPLAWGTIAKTYAVSTTEEILGQANFWSKGWAKGGSGQLLKVNFTSPASIIAFMPLGAFTALFRPLPGEVMNPFGILAGIEDFVLLVMLALAIRRTSLRELRDPILSWAILVIVAWSLFYSILSYQNLGTAVRFRSQIEPLLALVLIRLSRRRTAPAPAPTRVIAA